MDTIDASKRGNRSTFDRVQKSDEAGQQLQAPLSKKQRAGRPSLTYKMSV